MKALGLKPAKSHLTRGIFDITLVLDSTSDSCNNKDILLLVDIMHAMIANLPT